MNIIVFGGSGFLGSHVADKLSEQGHAVTIFDLKKSEYLRPDQKMVVGDIKKISDITDAIKGNEIVYNFSAIADLDDARKKPLETAEVNIIGNLHILENCKENNVKRYIFASTVYVYSRNGSFYKCSKKAAEDYIQEYQKKFNIDYTILRYGSLYGPRSDLSNGLTKIIYDSIKNKKVIYRGSPETMREYIHVEDAAISSVEAMNDSFKNQSINLKGKDTMRVYDLLKVLSEILGYKEKEIEFKTHEHPDHYVRTPYSYEPKLGRNYTPNLNIDMGQGLLQLIQEVQKKFL
jgi:UDP-glucose 4-epimerase